MSAMVPARLSKQDGKAAFGWRWSMGESIAEFMERRRRELARFGRQAKVAAHEVYGEAIRVGQDLRMRSPGEVMRHGAKRLQESVDRTAARLSDGAREARRQTGETLRRTGQNPIVRSVAIDAARGAGNAAGIVRGGVHAVQGLVDGATFANRLFDPLDSLQNPQSRNLVAAR